MTPKQWEFFQELSALAETMYPVIPSYDEIMYYTGNKSRGNVSNILNALSSNGYIKYTPKLARAWKITPKGRRLLNEKGTK
jgi:SOS-response transcriptional repressor LexA